MHVYSSQSFSILEKRKSQEICQRVRAIVCSYIQDCPKRGLFIQIARDEESEYKSVRSGTILNTRTDYEYRPKFSKAYSAVCARLKSFDCKDFLNYGLDCEFGGHLRGMSICL